MALVMLAASCLLHGTIGVGVTELPCHERTTVPTGATSALTAPSDGTREPDRWAAFVGEAARRFGIPPVWIRHVMQVESGNRVSLYGHPITSTAGAMGLMQLMPGTYEDMRQIYGLGRNPFDPHDNILAGTAYLRTMFDRFGSGVFAAYNAGPQRYQDYLDGKEPLRAETISYLAKLHLPLATASAKLGEASFAPITNRSVVAGWRHARGAGQAAQGSAARGVWASNGDVLFVTSTHDFRRVSHP